MVPERQTSGAVVFWPEVRVRIEGVTSSENEQTHEVRVFWDVQPS